MLYFHLLGVKNMAGYVVIKGDHSGSVNKNTKNFYYRTTYRKIRRRTKELLKKKKYEEASDCRVAATGWLD